MNRSKIEWCDHTWNPITGCRHNCKYCYARRMVARFSGDVRLNMMAKADYSVQKAADGNGEVYVLDKPMLNETGKILVYPFGFEPTYHRYRVDTLDKLKMGNNIFVGAMSDVFGKWVPNSWLDDIFAVCEKYPIHNFLFLTKNPERYLEYSVPAESKNLWFGTTITQEEEIKRISLLPEKCKTFISIEPLFEDIHPELYVQMFHLVDWIIIGAETGMGRGNVVPELGWIERIVDVADSIGVPVFMKESLLPVVGEHNMRRKFPKQLQHSEISPKMKKKLFGECAACKVYLKKCDMITLLARSRRGEQPKQFGFMCKDCFRNLCTKLAVDIPKLEQLEKGKLVGAGSDAGI